MGNLFCAAEPLNDVIPPATKPDNEIDADTTDVTDTENIQHELVADESAKQTQQERAADVLQKLNDYNKCYGTHFSIDDILLKIREEKTVVEKRANEKREYDAHLAKTKGLEAKIKEQEDQINKNKQNLFVLSNPASSLGYTFINDAPPVTGSETTDKVVNRVLSLIRKRSTINIDKYGSTLEENKSNFVDWLVTMQNDLMDGTVYLEKMKTLLVCEKDDFATRKSQMIQGVTKLHIPAISSTLFPSKI